MSDNSDVLISIILPVFNGEDYLEEAIVSCLSQSHQKLELIIVNDASTDASLVIAEGFAKKDGRIQIIKNRENKKLPVSLNLGHNQAKGDFVTWISHDNFFAPTALEDMLSGLNNLNVDIVFSDFAVINDKGEQIGKYKFDSSSSILLDNIIRASFLYKKDVFIRNNGYDEELYKIEDYAFWLRASINNVFYHLPKELYYYRKHSKSLTAKKTITQFQFENVYVERVNRMYLKFFKRWNINEIITISRTFTNLHLHQEIEVISFLKNYQSFKNDLRGVLEKYGQEKVLRDIDIRLRANILRFTSNQTPATIGWILIKRPTILFCRSKRKTCKIILECLF